MPDRFSLLPGMMLQMPGVSDAKVTGFPDEPPVAVSVSCVPRIASLGRLNVIVCGWSGVPTLSVPGTLLCPAALSPQQTTVPSERTAQACAAPVDTLV